MEHIFAENVEHLNVDDMWRAVGVYGKYQVAQTVLLLLSMFSSSVHALSFYFLGYEPPHKCNMPPNLTVLHTYGINESSAFISAEKCSLDIYSDNSTTEPVKLSCLYGNKYSLPRNVSILSDWDLTCDKIGIGQLPQTAVMVGQMIGSIFSSAADAFGRKKIQIVAQIGVLLTSASMVIISNFWLLCGVRILTGISIQLVQLTASVPFVELVPTNKRPTVCALEDFSFSFSLCLFAIAAYFLQSYNWRILALCSSLTALPFILDIFLMDESIRWLKLKKKTDEVVKLLLKICKTNNCSVQDILFTDVNGKYPQKLKNSTEDQHDCISETKSENILEYGGIQGDTNLNDTSKSTSYWEDLKSVTKEPKLVLQFCITWIMWFVDFFVSFSLYLLPDLMSSNLYLNFILNASVAMVGAPLGMFLMTRFPRKRCGIIFHTTCGLGLTGSTLILYINSASVELDIVRKACGLLARLATGICINFLGIFTSEIYPTNIRNTGTGIAFFFGRCGGIAASFATLMASYYIWLPGCVLAICCLVVAVAINVLPETGDKELSQNIEELRAINKKR